MSATNVSQFAQPKKHHGQQCVRNNVSSFTRALRVTTKLLITSMITDRIGRHEILLPINHENYNFQEKKNSQVRKEKENLHEKTGKGSLNILRLPQLLLVIKARVNEDTLLRTHCCHDVSWAAQTGIHLLRTQNVSEQNQKHFLCPGHKICVRNKCCARGQTGKHLCRQQCVHNNVSSFARAFRRQKHKSKRARTQAQTTTLIVIGQFKLQL